MVCYCHSSCIDLTVALVDCQAKVCASRLHHVCQGGYLAVHEINLDGAERNICRDYVGKLQMRSKPKKLKKVGHNNVYRTYELEGDEEELKEEVLGDGDEDFSTVPVAYHRGTVSVS